MMQVSFVGADPAFHEQLETWLERHRWKAQGILHESDKYNLAVFEAESDVVLALYANLNQNLAELDLLDEAIFPRGLELPDRYIEGVRAAEFAQAREKMPAADRKVAMLAREMAKDPSWW